MRVPDNRVIEDYFNRKSQWVVTTVSGLRTDHTGSLDSCWLLSANKVRDEDGSGSPNSRMRLMTDCSDRTRAYGIGKY